MMPERGARVWKRADGVVGSSSPLTMDDTEPAMHTVHAPSAVSAAKATAAALGLRADAAVVLHASNRIAVRLLPCDVLARVALLVDRKGAAFEVEVARRLAAIGSPVAMLEPHVEPRVYERDGFAITLWTYYEPVPPRDIEPAEYGLALERYHAGLRAIDLVAPHFTDRVAEAQAIVDDPVHSPELKDADRELLSRALRELTASIRQVGSTEQLLHGEPHPGNLLRTKDGLLFIDLETCCRGPVEFDIAHASRVSSDAWNPDPAMADDVSQHYAGAGRDLVRTCWTLMLAMVAAWRWDRDDRFPDGRRMGQELVDRLRVAVSGTPSL